MTSSINQTIAGRFGRRATDYDKYAGLQERVARALQAHLPDKSTEKVLEFGCGTGFLTGHLFERYEDAEFLITDLSEHMLEICQSKFPGQKNTTFRILDGEYPDLMSHHDLIVSSMTLQWFSDPVKALLRQKNFLREDGRLCYATLGPQGLQEWRNVLENEGFPSGLVQVPSLPGIFHEEFIPVTYENGLDFLRQIKAIGADSPREGYSAMSPVQLKQALEIFDSRSDGTVTWHIVYGQLEL